MRFKVLCFGRLRETLANELTLELAGSPTVGDLWNKLLADHASLAVYDGAIAIAVNQSFASASTVLQEGDEIALLPPVSGGCPAVELPLQSAHARLQVEPLHTAEVLADMRAPEDGAQVVFDGIVRNNTRGRRTIYLDYDSYPQMALNEMERLCREALAKFAIRDVRIVHRVGRQEIGDSSVVIVVNSGHRAAAFDACRYVIDSLKTSVPIWKKEYFEDGASWVDGDPFPEDLKPQRS